MFIPKAAIEKAMSAGWYKGYTLEKYENKYITLDPDGDRDALLFFPEIALQPEFWQCLGKSLVWTNSICRDCGRSAQICMAGDETCLGEDVAGWKYHAGRFYDLILTGGDLEAYWKKILGV